MFSKIFIYPIFFLFVGLLILSSCSDNNNQNQESNEENGRVLEFNAEVSFLRSEADTISTIKAAIADNNRSRSEGLMNVTDLPDDAGMFFIFDNQQTRSFWMANTPLPLDIMFVNSEMTIVRIHRNTQPYSQESIQSEEPAQYVVEVNAGYTLEHDIREGMKIAVDGADL
ncbi:DUF192 domain-containing protein [Rhodohalobacter sp. 614A]|uniref:DUF192 domain-containing protein n=1 Tax=Rhodohalobacter sp. 614A TaxID=2908649 RepID=UPI001F32C7F2|nr:DUF192 domain-containing protein [Rhodohalobacter sp. 614A]